MCLLDATIVFLEQRDIRINSLVGLQNTNNITLGHLWSGIIEEQVDEDVDHIGGDWHTVSKRKGSLRKKKTNFPSSVKSNKQGSK